MVWECHQGSGLFSISFALGLAPRWLPPALEVTQDFVLVPVSLPGALGVTVTTWLRRGWRGQWAQARSRAHLGTWGSCGRRGRFPGGFHPGRLRCWHHPLCPAGNVLLPDCKATVLEAPVSMAVRISLFFFLYKTKDTRNRLTQKHSKISTTAGRRQKQRPKGSTCLFR